MAGVRKPDLQRKKKEVVVQRKAGGREEMREGEEREISPACQGFWFPDFSPFLPPVLRFHKAGQKPSRGFSFWLS